MSAIRVPASSLRALLSLPPSLRVLAVSASHTSSGAQFSQRRALSTQQQIADNTHVGTIDSVIASSFQTSKTSSNPQPTAAKEQAKSTATRSPFYFETGYALRAKRRSRPFPPPFLSKPSGSFSDPLSTHDQSRDRRPKVDGQLIRGATNGDDAVLVSDTFIAANDGVGAWATREKGHAALWSRLIAHFWSVEAEKNAYGGENEPNPVAYLQNAFEKTKDAVSSPNEWHGTTTASSALISYDRKDPSHPVVFVTQLGDSAIMIVRPRDSEIIYKTKEQWHWFDCPRQLGTNSPDTPEQNAVMDRIEIEKGDVVLAMSDGVTDNLWDHEIMQNVVDSMHKWDNGEAQLHKDKEKDASIEGASDRMAYVAQELVKAARVIAEDPFAESPYMEKAVDEGLSIEGGK